LTKTDSLFPIENYAGRNDSNSLPLAIQDQKHVAGKIMACLAVDTDKQDLDGQRVAILAYGKTHNIKVDEFIEVEMSGRKNTNKRPIDELISKVRPGDTVIVAELSRMGRSILDVINIANELAKNSVILIAVKQNLNLQGKHDAQTKAIVNLFSLLAQVGQDLMSSRTKAGLAARKAEGVKLGRPKGSLGKSKLDKHLDKIVEDLKARVSKAAIARRLHCSRPTIIKYVKSRGLA
jgi:DNA invertase Pin-like site-specific DNA recombinase